MTMPETKEKPSPKSVDKKASETTVKKTLRRPRQRQAQSEMKR